MKPSIILTAYFAVAPYLVAQAAEVGPWRATAESEDVREIAKVIDRVGISPWPKVFSVLKQDDSPARTAENDEFAAVGERILSASRKEYLKAGTSLPAETLAAVDSMVALRDCMAASPSYRNLVVVDSMNRYAIVMCLKLLSKPGTETTEVLQRLKRLGSYEFTADSWITVMLDETGRAHRTADAAAGPDRDAAALRSLQKAYFPTKEIWVLHAPAEYKSAALYRGQDFAVLAMRLLGSDYYLRSAIPAIVGYFEKAPSPSVGDSYEKIKGVLSMEALVPDSLGARFVNRNRASAVVSEFFDQITGVGPLKIERLVDLID